MKFEISASGMLTKVIQEDFSEHTVIIPPKVTSIKPGAVSYTHLDVYKRQAFYCAYFATYVNFFDRDFLTNDPALIQTMILECENGVRDDYYSEVLEVCAEMLASGYTFDTENAHTDSNIFDFTIENGKIKPICLLYTSRCG